VRRGNTKIKRLEEQIKFDSSWRLRQDLPSKPNQRQASYENSPFGPARGGNVGIGTSTPAYPLQVVGSCAATTFVTVSDRNAKENFKPVSARDILAKVAALPLSRWNYKEDKTQEHIGPMAQDFHFAFDVGPDDKHITTVDEGGVALAAIQGLNQKVEDRSQDLETRSRRIEAENAELRRQNDSLNSRLSDLEAAVKALAARK
jgi:hypothetical protein